MSYEYIETTKEEMIEAIEELSVMTRGIMTTTWKKNINEQVGKLRVLVSKLSDTKK